MLYIIIPVFNRWSFTKGCLESLQRQNYNNFKTIVVDHGSTDHTEEYIKESFSDVIVLKGDQSMWWTAATNTGVQYALAQSADYILTLNNDLVVEADYLANLIDIATLFPTALVGSVSIDISDKEKVRYAGEKWNPLLATYAMAVPLNIPYLEFRKKYQMVPSDLLPGRGTLVPRVVFEKIGLYDEVHFPHYMADHDFSLRARKAGFPLMVSAGAAVYNHSAATGLRNIYKKETLAFWKDFVLSRRSPNNIAVRWNWAWQHASFPPFYFLIDYGRILTRRVIESIFGRKL